MVGDVQLEAYITVFCPADELAVHINIAHVHDAAEVQHETSAFQRIGRREVVAVPAASHFLEASARETALDVGRHVGVVGFLVGGRRHPGLLNLEIVRQVHPSPLAVVEQRNGSARQVAVMKQPTLIEIDHQT